MRITPAPSKRLDSAVARNSKRPQHTFMQAAAPGYTFLYAHPHVAIATGVTGPLPARLQVSNLLLGTLLESIHPAEENWGYRSSHLFEKNSIYSPAYAEFIGCFHCVSNLCWDAMDTLLTEFDLDSWPFNSVSRENVETLLEGVHSLRARSKIDPQVAYVNLPFLIPLALDMLLKLDHWVETEWAAGEIAKFRSYLLYPISQPSSYNLNINYLYEHQVAIGPAIIRHLLVGYRLGRIHPGTDRHGRPGNAIILDKLRITTCHWKKIDPKNHPDGFISEIEFG